MISGYILTSLSIAFCFIFLGLLIVSRNPKSTLNKLFLLFSLSISVWLVTNYIGGDPHVNHGQSLIANRLIFFFGGLAVLALLAFVKKLVARPLTNRPYWVINIIILLCCFSPWIVENVKLQDTTTYTINFGWLSTVYFIILLVNFINIMVTLFASRRTAKGLLRLQINAILASLAISLTVIIATNALLPFLFNYYSLTNIGSFFMAILVFGIAFTMIKHRLFDIRLVVARSAAYVLTLSVAALIIIAPTIAATTYLLHTPLKAESIVVLVIVTFIVAMVFQPLRSWFNKITNKVFYRDYYEIQDVIDRLGNLLVGSVDPDEIEEQSTKILGDAVRPTFLEYVLVADKESNRLELLKHLQHSAVNLAVLDELDAHHQATLYNALNNGDVAVAVRLRTKREDLGFIVLGYKQSGLVYSETDKRLLTIAADEIAISLQNALRFREIQNFNKTLNDKVIIATNQLRRANDRLKELDETKDDFISMASHQLRTPLTSIKGYLSMVLEGDAGKVTTNAHKFLEEAFDSSQRMVYLTNDLLNVSRVKTGKFVIEKSQINLADIVNEEIGQLNKTATNKNIQLTYNKPKSFPDINLDETKTRQVIMNFIDNALYYTPSGGHIIVDLKDTPSTVEYRVTDNGIGVPKSEVHQLFTKFFRAANARKARPDGTGIGLFMAKKVIDAQNGSVIFQTEEGKGSTFGFRFPKDSPAAK